MTFIFKIEEEKCDKLIIGGDKNENIKENQHFPINNYNDNRKHICGKQN